MLYDRCQQCGARFKYESSTIRRCPVCRGIADINVDDIAPQKVLKHYTYRRTCIECGKEFGTNRKLQLTCSIICNYEYEHSKKKAYQKAYEREKRKR